MNNIPKIEIANLPPVFGEKQRPTSKISGKDLASLKNEGLNFDGYTARKGDTFQFPAFEDMVVLKQPVREGSQSYVFLVACMRTRNGITKESYLNVNSLAKRDIHNDPVMPEFYECGSVEARLRKLAELGKVSADKEATIEVPVFDGDHIARESKIDEAGNTYQATVTRQQTVAILS